MKKWGGAKDPQPPPPLRRPCDGEGDIMINISWSLYCHFFIQQEGERVIQSKMPPPPKKKAVSAPQLVCHYFRTIAWQAARHDQAADVGANTTEFF